MKQMTSQSKSPEYAIKEGVESVWFYHWAEKDSVTSLCGRMVMPTGVRRGTPPGYHISERWCGNCERLKLEDK